VSNGKMGNCIVGVGARRILYNCVRLMKVLGGFSGSLEIFWGFDLVCDCKYGKSRGTHPGAPGRG
jgi:hypothetical protein